MDVFKGTNLEVNTDEIENKKGLYINLDARAVALEGIMAVYNQINKTRGAQSHSGIQNLENNYGQEKADLIIKEMDRKKKLAVASLDGYLEFLIAAELQKQAGIDEITIQLERESLRSALSHSYGPDNAKAHDREKLIKQVQPPHLKHLSRNI